MTRKKSSSDWLYAYNFRFYFTPFPGFFSPFPHGTSSLSVNKEYLALEGGPPIFNQDYTCPDLLFSANIYISLKYEAITLYGIIFQQILILIYTIRHLGCSAFARHY